MDRCAVLVDAGYLVAEGAKAYVSPAAKRGDVFVEYAAVAAHLADRARADSGVPLLRTYWYDGAIDAVPTSDQLLVAALPDVKIRLGRLIGGRQKGVDSLVYRDLTVLSRERAASDVFLVAGDEDLREGVAAAQELGVRVTLWGVGSGNQARTLAAEADRIAALDLSSYFSVATGSAFAIGPPEEAVAAPSADEIRATGRAHATEWLDRASAEERGELLASHPSVPRTLDAELLRRGQAVHGDLRGADEARKLLRAGFWDAIFDAQGDGGDTGR